MFRGWLAVTECADLTVVTRCQISLTGGLKLGIEENTKDIRDVNDRKYRGLTFATGEWGRTNNIGKEPHRKEGTTLNQLNT